MVEKGALLHDIGYLRCSGELVGIPAQIPKKLIDACIKIKDRGAVGCLISGGCLPDGSIPLGRFVDAIAEVKERLDLAIETHTGLIDIEMAERLREACVDAVSTDIIGSDETIREIYNLNASTKDYKRTLKTLKDSGIPFTPHVLIGLHYGGLKGELDALKMIAKYQPSALILISFFPIKGALMEKVKPTCRNVFKNWLNTISW